MDVPDLEAFNAQPGREAMGGNFNGTDLRGGRVDFGAAVALLVDVGVGLELIRAGGGGLWIDWLSEN